jgi:hypothetical protein
MIGWKDSGLAGGFQLLGCDDSSVRAFSRMAQVSLKEKWSRLFRFAHSWLSKLSDGWKGRFVSNIQYPEELVE